MELGFCMETMFLYEDYFCMELGFCMETICVWTLGPLSMESMFGCYDFLWI